MSEGYTKALGHWSPPLGIAVLSVLLALFGERATSVLMWHRLSLATEPWRLFTGHLVHLDLPHLALNLIGLVILWVIVGRAWRVSEWALIITMVAFLVGLGLVAVPQLAWYAGLSGLLHGIFAAGAIGLWRWWRMGAAIIFMFLALKAGAELVWPPDAIAQAHWLGSLAGALTGIMWGLARRSD